MVVSQPVMPVVMQQKNTKDKESLHSTVLYKPETIINREDRAFTT